MPADAGEFDGHAIDLEHAVLELDLAEADAVLDALDDGLVAVRQAVEHVIQVGLLGRPELGGGHGRREDDGGGAVGADVAGLAHGGDGDLGAIESAQFAGQNEMRPGRAGDADGGLERGVLVLGIEFGDDGDVLHMQRRKGHEVGLAVDAAQAPEVAVVQAGGRGVLVEADGHQIALAGLEGLGDVDVEGGEAAFVVAAPLAVDEDFGAVVGAVEMPEDVLAGERGRNIHQAAVEADVRRWPAGAFLVSEHGEAFDFPIGGDGDVLPVGVGGIGGGEGGHRGVGGEFALDGGADAVIELESPGAGHGQHGRIAQPEAIDGDGHVAGHGHGRRKGRRCRRATPRG